MAIADYHICGFQNNQEDNVKIAFRTLIEWAENKDFSHTPGDISEKIWGHKAGNAITWVLGHVGETINAMKKTKNFSDIPYLTSIPKNRLDLTLPSKGFENMCPQYHALTTRAQRQLFIANENKKCHNYDWSKVKKELNL